MRFKTPFLSLVILSFSITCWSADQGVGFQKIRQKGSLSYYSGKVIIEGEYRYSKSDEDQEIMGDQVSFYASKKDAKLIPRDTDDPRMPWFCFKDTQQAKDLLGIIELLKSPKVCEVSGVATVEITNYFIDKGGAETNDIAELVKVIKKSKPRVRQFSKNGQECK
jgi:hypothetical protein